MNYTKISWIFIFIVVSVGVLHSHFSNQFFPTIPAAFFLIGVLGIGLVYIVSTRREALVSVSVIVGTTVLLRWYLYAAPASYIGMDPDRYARWTDAIIQAGSTTGVPPFIFYRDVPAGLILPAMTSIATGLPVRFGMGVYAITFGILFPLLAVVFASRIHGRSTGVVVSAAVIGSLLSESIKFGYWPIPQNLVILLFQIFVLALLIHLHRRSWSSRLLIFILLLVLVFSHKIPLALVASVLFLLAVYQSARPHIDAFLIGLNHRGIDPQWLLLMASILIIGIWGAVVLIFSSSAIALIGVSIGIAVTWILSTDFSFTFNRTNSIDYLQFNGHILFLLALVLFLFQWTIYTDYLGSFVLYKFIKDIVVTVPENQFTAVIPANNGMLDVFFHKSHILVLLLASALSVLWVGIVDRGRSAVLISVAGLAFLTAPLQITKQFTTGVGVSRTFPNFSAVLAGFLAVGVVGVSRTKVTKRISVLVLIIILLFQSFAIVTVPDYPGTPRQYLDQSEVDAKEFNHQYVTGTVVTDYFYAIETISPLPNTHTGSKVVFHPETDGYVSGTLADQEHKYILHRTQIEVYRFNAPGAWRLTWNPETELNVNYSSVYDNGNVKLYTNSSAAPVLIG